MNAERAALLLANCPTDADFTRLGPIVAVVAGDKTFAVYERKMFLDGLVQLNRRLGNAPDAQPAPVPVRHYEIWAEGVVVKADTY